MYNPPPEQTHKVLYQPGVSFIFHVLHMLMVHTSVPTIRDCFGGASVNEQAAVRKTEGYPDRSDEAPQLPPRGVSLRHVASFSALTMMAEASEKDRTDGHAKMKGPGKEVSQLETMGNHRKSYEVHRGIIGQL